MIVSDASSTISDRRKILAKHRNQIFPFPHDLPSKRDWNYLTEGRKGQRVKFITDEYNSYLLIN